MTHVPLAPESLLAHEAFVRSIVRGILRDAHAVEDVLQETWTTALVRPRAGAYSLRGWLGGIARHRALQRVRTDGRRTKREVLGARPEAVTESVSASEERLELRGAVVRAVLALAEPYRTVVLLHYEHGLAPCDIARRTGGSAATVRSQLARAHAHLRAALDAHDPQRRWALLCTPWNPLRSTVGTWTLALAAGALAGAALGYGWPSRQVPAEEHAPAVAALTRDREGSSGRSPSAHVQVEGSDLRVLREYAVQVQREITHRALAVPAHFAAAERELLELPGTGLAKLLYRGSPLAREVLKREGGAFFSFVTLDHSFDRQPDLGLDQDGRFLDGTGVGRLGRILALGDHPLASLAIDGTAPPGLSPEVARAWDDLCSADGMQRMADALHEALTRRDFSMPFLRPVATEGETYVVRTTTVGERGQLVAFRVLERDEEGVVIAWRVLRSWSAGVLAGPASGEFSDVPAAAGARQREIAALDGAGLLDLLGRIRGAAAPLLWTVPEELKVEWTNAVGPRTSFAQREGFTRLLLRGEYGPLVSEEGGGYVYSFTRDSHDGQDDPELGLEGGCYAAAPRGVGWIVDLGALDFDDLRSVLAGGDPAGLDALSTRRIAFLRGMRTDLDKRGRASVSNDDQRLARTLSLDWTGKAQAQLGHTYLVRSVTDSSDVLVAITTLAVDESGHTVAWRLLESFAVR